MIAEENQKTQNTDIFDTIDKYGHEQVVFCRDEATGLKSIIAIHDTTLGPALGGTRLWNYVSSEEALRDVLRLSEGMTYKAAISGVNLGGGKAIIMGKPEQKSEALLRRFGQFVNTLGGRYITAEDVNMKVGDMEHIHAETNHVTGIPESMGGNGDPSPVTAFTTYLGMKAAVKYKTGNDTLKGNKILIQGLGNVGLNLLKRCAEEGADVYITDIDENKLKTAKKEVPGCEVIQPDKISDTNFDIYAPCALGATINDESIEWLPCSIIAGAANNQLLDAEKHGKMLLQKGIIYAPDFLINSGGLMNVYAEHKGMSRDSAMTQAESVYLKTLDIIKESFERKLPTQQIAIEHAKKRIDTVKHVNAKRLTI